MKKRLLIAMSAVALFSNIYAQTEESGFSNPIKQFKANESESIIPDENQEGLSYFYHETFDNIGGSMDAPLNFNFGSATFGDIPADMLTDKEHIVTVKSTCKRAGGAVLVTGKSAYLNVELGEMRGRNKEFDLYFKIKSEKENEESVFSLINTNMGITVESYYNAPVKTEWTWYMVSFTTGNPYTNLEFDNELEDNGLYIDEIIVVVKDTFLNGPIVLPASNVDDEEFTANWFYSYDAKGIYLDVFSYADELSTRETISETQNFAGINVTDGKLNVEDPKMPEGWNYRFTKTMDKVFPNTNDGYSIVLNKEIEYLSTPNYDEAPYTALSFDLKAEEGATGKLIVEEKLPRLYSYEDQWVNTPYEWSKIGEFDLAQYTSEKKNIDLTSSLSGKGIYIRYTVSDNQDKGAEISNISYTYGGDICRAKIMEIENLELTGNQFIVSDIDSKTEYFYRIRSFDDNYVSDYSPVVRGRGPVPADEMNAPEVLEPENISKASFTAKWMPSIYTNAYRCEVYREYTAKEDIEDFVFYSEDFNSLQEGTVDKPIYGSISQNDAITYYNVLPGYLIDHGLQANGMLGIYNVFKEGSGWAFGHIYSPVYNMPENRDYKLKITAHAEIGTKFKISSYNDESKEIQTSRVGTFNQTTQDFEFKFPAGNYTFFEIDLTEGYYTLLIDKMEICLDMEAGDKISGIVDETHSMTATSKFETPYWTENDKIYYQVKGEFIQPNEYKTLDFYISEPSAKMYVDYSGVGIKEATNTTVADVYVANGELNINVSETQKVTVYNMTGIPVATFKAKEGHNVYNLNESGVYIVVVGNKCVKVVK